MSLIHCARPGALSLIDTPDTGNITTTLENRTIHITRNGDGDDALPGQQVRFELRGIVCGFAGPAGDAAIETVLGSGDASIEEADNLPIGTILPSPIMVHELALLNPVAGEPSSLRMNATLSTALAGEDGARITIVLPDGFSIAAALFQFEVAAPDGQGGVTWDAELPPPHAVSCPAAWMSCGVTVVLTLQGADALPRDTRVGITLHGVQNRLFAGPSGAFLLSTAVAGGGVMDEGGAATTLAPGLIRNVVVSPDMIPGDAATSLNISFTLPSEFPLDSRLVVTFPPGVTPTAGSEVYGSVGGLDVGEGDVTITSVGDTPSVAVLFQGQAFPRGEQPRTRATHPVPLNPKP